MPVAVDHERPIARLDDVQEMREDAAVALGPGRDQVRPGEIIGLAEMGEKGVAGEVAAGRLGRVDPQQRLQDGVRLQELVVLLGRLPEMRHQGLELLAAAAGLGVILHSHERIIFLLVDPVDLGQAQLLGQPEADLVALVPAELILAREVVQVLLDLRAARIRLEGDLGGAKAGQDPDELADLGLTLGGQDVIRLHVEDVTAGVVHVIAAEDKDLGQGRAVDTVDRQPHRRHLGERRVRGEE